MTQEKTDQGFDPLLRAEDLSRTVLIDLWQRTVTAHENLFRTWYGSVSDRFGETVAKDLAGRAWPKYRKDVSMLELFSDDLKLAVAAVELMPTLLTEVKLNVKLIPDSLRCSWIWFRVLRVLSDFSGNLNRSKDKTPVNRKRPALFGYLRAKIIDISRCILLKAWQMSDSMESLFKRKHDKRVADMPDLEGLDAPALAQLWNMAAVAYMMVTHCWYEVVTDEFGTNVAQEVEKDVWMDRGAAEYDLGIGLKALGVTGNDVESLLRSFQFAPGEVGILNVEFELKSPNYGILHHQTCPAIDRFEDYDNNRLKHCCDICVLAMPLSGEMLNPDIKCRPLKLPPRKKTGLACEWEYKL
jgi:hypothetical protein